MIDNIKKAAVFLENSDERLFPLARVIPKELLPLGDVPFIQRVVEEVTNSGIKNIDFIVPPDKKIITEHFKNTEKLSNKEDEFKEKYLPLSFSYLSSKKNTKSNYITARLKTKMSDEVFSFIFSDTVFYGKTPSIQQLFSVYKTSQKTVVALKEVKDEEVSTSNIVEVEKIASRLYKIKKIIKNPNPEDVGSRIALVDRYVFTPLIFDYLESADNVKDSVVNGINSLINSGKSVYGYECEGEWFFIKDKESYLKSSKFFINNTLSDE